MAAVICAEDSPPSFSIWSGLGHLGGGGCQVMRKVNKEGERQRGQWRRDHKNREKRGGLKPD